MLDSYKRLCYRKRGSRPGLKPRPKHPTKVHVWAGISWNGATRICIFTGIMDADMYIHILQQCLLPSIRGLYPLHHRLMQDNDPKHTSKAVQAFFQQNQINWWKTPPESPDINPIECVWHELKVSFYTVGFFNFTCVHIGLSSMSS